MRLVEVDKVTGDVMGLMNALKHGPPSMDVKNVASSGGKTLVWLGDLEKGDPRPIVKKWQDHAYITLTVTGETGEDGVHEVLADGESKFIVCVKKGSPETGEVLPGEEVLCVGTSPKTDVSDDRPTLSHGVAAFEVGPESKAKEVVVRVLDPAGRMRDAAIRLRFASTEEEEKVEEPAPKQKPEGKGWLSGLAQSIGDTQRDPSPAFDAEPRRRGFLSGIVDTLLGRGSREQEPKDTGPVESYGFDETAAPRRPDAFEQLGKALSRMFGGRR